MKQQRDHREMDEPVGIVISAGVRGDVIPRFAAFVWGPAPEAAESEHKLDARAA